MSSNIVIRENNIVIFQPALYFHYKVPFYPCVKDSIAKLEIISPHVMSREETARIATIAYMYVTSEQGYRLFNKTVVEAGLNELIKSEIKFTATPIKDTEFRTINFPNQ